MMYGVWCMVQYNTLSQKDHLEIDLDQSIEDHHFEYFLNIVVVDDDVVRIGE
jgi:hypothetical protein